MKTKIICYICKSCGTMVSWERKSNYIELIEEDKLYCPRCYASRGLRRKMIKFKADNHQRKGQKNTF